MLAASVSVLVPTYNGAKYLRDCLDSVLAQTYQKWELIVVDDCSTDSTFEIALSYAERDPRIRVERNAMNVGLVGNWHRCMELARGAWLKFVFQDDLIAPQCLAKMLAVVHPDTSIVACRRDFLFAEDTDKDTRRSYAEYPTFESVFGTTSYVSAPAVCEAAIDHFGMNFAGEPTAVLLRRDVFTKFGGFNPNLIEIVDAEYWIRIASNTGLNYVPESLAEFRVHGESTTARNFAFRSYGMLLDRLVLLHEYAFNESYSALRKVALDRSPPVDFTALLAHEAKEARWIAVDAVRNRNDSTALEEWERLLQTYPRIIDLLYVAGGPRLTVLGRLTTEGLHSALRATDEKIIQLQQAISERDTTIRQFESKIAWITNRTSYRLLKRLQGLFTRG